MEINKLSDLVNLHPYYYYCAQQFANTIGTKAPKINFKNKSLETLFKNDLRDNDIAKINYELVRISSLHGNAFLGISTIKTIDKKNKNMFVIGIPLSVKKVGFEIIELEMVIDIYKSNSSTYYIVEKWSLEKNKFFCKRYGFLGAQQNNQTSLKSTGWKVQKETSLNRLSNKIPYLEFSANPFSQPDLYNVPKNLFKDFDDNIEILKNDSLVNKGMIFLNFAMGATTTNAIQELNDAIKDPKKIVYQNNSPYSLISTNGGAGMYQPVQGQFLGDGIITKLKFYDQKIRKFGFMRSDSTVMGTKNAHSAEIANLNQDADDYLEMKANLLENSWKKFIDEIYAPWNDITSEDCDVEVIGSTKYLQNPNNVYSQNQNGILTNPNDIYSKKEVFNNGKNKNKSRNKEN